VVISAYGFFSYLSKREEILHTMHGKLFSTAIETEAILGKRFADRVVDKSSISPQEDMENILSLSKVAKAAGARYVYMLILDDHNVTRFIVSSATDHEIKTGEMLTHYYDPYPFNKNIDKAFKTKQVVLDPWEKDAWGVFASVFIPHTTPNGKKYIIGVDIDMKLIDDLSRAAALKEIMGILLILLALSPLLYLLNLFQRDNTFLQHKIDEATVELKQINGHLEQKVSYQTQELLKQFYYDTLTTLPNRNKLQEEMYTSPPFALAIIDIDAFKEINDFFGILAGDTILLQFSRFINSYHPTYRISGDQFALLFPQGTFLDEILFLLQTLIKEVEEKEFFIEGQIIPIHLSIGLAQGDNANLISADIAVHQAKITKIPLAIYNEDEKIRNHFQHNLTMANAIKKALFHSKVVCHFQPIFSMSTQKIEKYEALVRILDEHNVLIYPINFLDLAKRTKHYPYITREVVRQTCQIFATRTDHVSINLSSSDIGDPELSDFIINTITQTHTADRITFEILESEWIDNFEAVSAFITTIKALGGHIAIDDFGTGYSSFENILKLNIDYIKIDGSLIRNIDTNKRHAIVVETIADFAQKIGAKTIAEFVSSEAIYHKVKALGIDYAQGYFIGKPDVLPLIKGS
jgi:diguanylate cyclase (GGDEF)-like protein